MDIINRKASCGYFTDAFVYLGDGCFFVRNIAETGITYPSNNDSCIISLHKNSGFFIGDSYYDEYDYKRSRILRDIVEIYIRLEDLYDMKLPLDYDSDKFTKKYLGERISLKVKDDEKYWKVDAAIKFLDVLDNDIMSEKLAIDIDLIKSLWLLIIVIICGGVFRKEIVKDNEKPLLFKKLSKVSFSVFLIELL